MKDRFFNIRCVGHDGTSGTLESRLISRPLEDERHVKDGDEWLKINVVVLNPLESDCCKVCEESIN